MKSHLNDPFRVRVSEGRVMLNIFVLLTGKKPVFLCYPTLVI